MLSGITALARSRIDAANATKGIVLTASSAAAISPCVLRSTDSAPVSATASRARLLGSNSNPDASRSGAACGVGRLRRTTVDLVKADSNGMSMLLLVWIAGAGQARRQAPPRMSPCARVDQMGEVTHLLPQGYAVGAT
jgi:hypothetical protein